MPMKAGDKLGPYEILTPIGVGGMGEVYRAHDSRLNRDVAIKLSNAQFTERFTREARAIAALNHTNICHLYDVGPDYLVMEYVEGRDLRGPLDFDDALPILQQLIDGIEAAHEKNIIHRDLNRIKELTARIAKATVRRVAERVAITKEIIIQELWENAQRGKDVRGGSAVTNRALELIGKELGMFRDPEDKPPMNLEDLPPEALANMIAQAEAKAAQEAEAAAAQGGDAPPPPKVN